MAKCWLCKYYDKSVDCCNADDLCYTQGYEKGYADAIDELVERIKLAIRNSAYMTIGVMDLEHIAEQLKEQMQKGNE